MPGSRKKRFLFTLAALLGLCFSACGGGGGGETAPGGTSSLPPKMLSWAPPTAYTDSSPLNPVIELDSFEIYVKETGPFGYSDTPVAYVRAVDPSSGQLTTAFNLANLAPYLSPGVVYQVSLRAVALTGARSDFSSPANFSF